LKKSKTYEPLKVGDILVVWTSKMGWEPVIIVKPAKIRLHWIVQILDSTKQFEIREDGPIEGPYLLIETAKRVARNLNQ